MTEDVANGASFLEPTKKFWSDALRTMNGSVGGLGTDLNMQNVIPVAWHSFDLNLKINGQDLEGRLSVLVDADGELVDSWLQVVRLSIAGLNGTYKCQGQPDDQTCRLVAKTLGGIVTQSAEEDLNLDGSERTGFNGQVGVKGALTYPLKGGYSQN
jgi:hypothetical protein